MSHALSRSLDLSRKATINPNNDPHYYAYKLVNEPPPPPPPQQVQHHYQLQLQQQQQQQQQQHDYEVSVEEGDIEELDLEDNEAIMASGNKSDVVERLNRKIAALQKRNKRLDQQLYGGDSGGFDGTQSLQQIGSADEIYKNTGGIWDAEILDHFDEMTEVQAQRIQELHQSYQQSKKVRGTSPRRSASPRRASPRYDRSTLYSPQHFRESVNTASSPIQSARGVSPQRSTPPPKKQPPPQDGDEDNYAEEPPGFDEKEKEDEAWMYVYKETEPHYNNYKSSSSIPGARRYSFSGLGSTQPLAFGRSYKPPRLSLSNSGNWADRVTTPEPFSFTDRSTGTSRSQQNVQDYIKEKEDKEKIVQFKARPVPASTSEPRFKEIMQEQDNRRAYTHMKAVQITKSRENPFSFYERDKEKHEKKKKEIEELQNRPPDKPPPFKANSVPDFVINPISAEEDELARQERIQLRATENLLMASLPPRMENQPEKESIRPRYVPLQPSHQPQINKKVPDFKKLQNEFAAQQERIKEERRQALTVTSHKEFTFSSSTPSPTPTKTRAPSPGPSKRSPSPAPASSQSSNPMYNFKAYDASSTPEPPAKTPPARRNPSPAPSSPSTPQSVLRSSMNSPNRPPSPSKVSFSPSGSPSLKRSSSPLPTHKTTLAAELKRQMAHKKLENAEDEKKRSIKEENERERKLKLMSKEVAIRLKPFDETLPTTIDERIKERKKDEIEKTREYKQRMNEMHEKVENSRLTLFERYKVENAGRATEKRLDNSLKNLGLEDEDLKARVEKTYGKKYFEKLYGKEKPPTNSKTNSKDYNIESESDNESDKSDKFEDDDEEKSEKASTRSDPASEDDKSDKSDDD